MSDKIKGQMRKGSGGNGATNVPWKPVRSAPDRGRKVPRNWGAYVPEGGAPDGSINTSSPYTTHRGLLKGGDRRYVDGGQVRKHARTYPLQGNPWDKASG